MTLNWGCQQCVTLFSCMQLTKKTRHFTLLYYTILYTILYFTILYSTIFYGSAWYFGWPNIYTILYFTILYHTILYYTILYYTQYPAFEFFDNLVSWSATRWRHLTSLSVTWISWAKRRVIRQPREFVANERYTVADQSFDTTTSNA